MQHASVHELIGDELPDVAVKNPLLTQREILIEEAIRSGEIMSADQLGDEDDDIRHQ